VSGGTSHPANDPTSDPANPALPSPRSAFDGNHESNADRRNDHFGLLFWPVVASQKSVWSAVLVSPETVRGGWDNGAVIETQLDPRRAITACVGQWRHAIVECDDVGLPDQVRDIESVSRMVYSIMLDAVTEMESRNIAVTAGFRNTKQLLAGC
jgi:hypothetical protein